MELCQNVENHNYNYNIETMSTIIITSKFYEIVSAFSFCQQNLLLHIGKLQSYAYKIL